jgi:hypothetical protein
MGWLRKKFRQLDRRVRKIFGKNAWLKIAALIGGTYIGMSGDVVSSTGKFFGEGGKFRAFGSNLKNGVKNIFWNPKGEKVAQVGKVGEAGYVPASPAGLTWVGQAAAQTGLNVASGYGQAKLMEGDPRGQYVAAGSNEPSTISTVQNAYNTYAGQSVNILDVYNNLDYGPASTQSAENYLMRRGSINIAT